MEILFEYLAIVGVVLVVLFVGWIFNSITRYKLCRTLGYGKSWLVWLPFGGLSNMAFTVAAANASYRKLPDSVYYVIGFMSLLTTLSSVPCVGTVLLTSGSIAWALNFVFSVIAVVNLCNACGKSPVATLLVYILLPFGTGISSIMMRKMVVEYNEH